MPDSRFPDYDENNPASEVYLPVSVLYSRFERSRMTALRDAKATKWWEFRRRYILNGAAAAYAVEIEDLLAVGGATTLARMQRAKA